MADADRPLIDLELVRRPDDRRAYDLGDVGSLRVTGFWSRRATATAGPRTWELARTSLWTTASAAADEAGAETGAFVPRTLRRGGTLTWQGRSYELRPASSFRERYALVEDGLERAVFEGKGWGRRPVAVSLDPTWRPEPGLLLFAAFVVRALADDASGAAGGSTAAVTAATGG